jgi:hypothetical protein
VHHAVSPPDAVPYVPPRGVVHRQFQQMLAKGIVRDAGAGSYWLDQAAYKADLKRRRRIVMPLIVILLLILAAIPLFFYQNSAERSFLHQASGPSGQ